MRKKKKCLLLCLIVSILFANLCAAPIYAQEMEKIGTLTLKNAAPDSRFVLYQVEVKQEDDTFTVTPEFQNYAVDFNIKTEDDMKRVSNTLAAYIAQDQPKAFAEQTADEEGRLTFPALQPGLYIAIGENVERNGARFRQAPVLAFLPATDKDGTVLYDLEAMVKPSVVKDETAYSVCKIWQGDVKNKRPDSIEVNLLQDDKVFETITLNAENNWQYKWTELPKGFVYKVVEKNVPSGYNVEITENAGAFTIKNSKTPDRPREPKKKLPQTGQLWWPVSILACAGIICLAIGIAKRRSRHEKYAEKK